MAAGAGGLDEDQLFFAEETADLNDKIDHECFSFSSSFACSDSKMLCFGGFNGGDVTNSSQESGSICMDSSSLSSTSSTKLKTWPKSMKKRNGSGDEPGCISGSSTGSHKGSKKAKSSNPTFSSPCLHHHNRPTGNDGKALNSQEVEDCALF